MEQTVEADFGQSTWGQSIFGCLASHFWPILAVSGQWFGQFWSIQFWPIRFWPAHSASLFLTNPILDYWFVCCCVCVLLLCVLLLLCCCCVVVVCCCFVVVLVWTGFHTPVREPKRAHLRVLAFKNPTKFHEKTPKETHKERKWVLERKTRATFLAPTLRGPTLRGPIFSGFGPHPLAPP